MDNREHAIEFAEWIGDKGYQKITVYNKYEKDEDDGSVSGSYENCCGRFWSTYSEEEIGHIMADNNNEEFDWVLKNIKTVDELYSEFKYGAE